MFFNNLKSIFRQLQNNKIFSFINAIGLIVGMISFIVIIQFVRYESNYDSFHQNTENLYRIRNDQYNGTQLEKMSVGCPPVLAPLVKESFTEVENFTRLLRTIRMVVSEEQHNHIRTDDIYFADPAIMSMFSFPVIKGRVSGALDAPYKAVITESFAQRIFGDSDPIGKNLRFHSRYFDVNCQISAVLKDIPANSNLRFEALLSMATYESCPPAYGKLDNWNSLSMFFSYLQLKPAVKPEILNSQITSLVNKHTHNPEDGVHSKYVLENLKQIHLNPNEVMLFNQTTISKQTLYLLLVVAIVIMLIVWVNYLNLSAAKAMDRAKEVGICKVSGARKADLMRQFFLESFLFSTICIIITIAILYIFQQPIINSLQRKIDINMFSSIGNLLVLLGLFVGSGIISGAYPAFILSSFQPVNVLKGQLYKNEKSVNIKKALVVFQFAASIFLIAGVLAIYKQVTYMQNMNIGLDASQLLVVRTPVLSSNDLLLSKLDHLKQEINSYPEFKGLAGSYYIPGKEIRARFELQTNQNSSERAMFNGLDVNADFIPVTGLKLLCGRMFYDNIKNDDNAIIVNKTGIKALGFDSPESALNQSVYVSRNNNEKKIIGVVDDYHHLSAKEAIEPVVLIHATYPMNYYSLQIKSNDMVKSVKKVERLWKDVFPDDPFDYFFLNDFFNKQYKSEILFTNIFSFFTLIAILVACLGLFGISYHSTLRRTKEIGIRKILGSSVLGITLLFEKETFLLILFSSFLANPLFAWFINSWLDNYAYSIKIGWYFYVFPIVVLLLISLITTGAHILKAARSNPINALRYE